MAETWASSRVAGRTVLVIDDSKTIRRSAELFLAQAGCTVVLAEDGLDALAQMARVQPDLVFCDITMPRLDGFQTCAIAKKNPQFQAVPWVMVSNHDGVFNRARARIVGCVDYLTKPFTKEQLLQCVTRYLGAWSPSEGQDGHAGPA